MLVKVWNHNVHPYSEKFRDQLITIQPNQFIEMDEDEADYFLQTFTFPVKDPQGRPDAKHFKKLKIEIPQELIDARKARDPLVNHANGQRVSSAQELAESLMQFKHLLAEKPAGEESDLLAKNNKMLAKENKLLKTRLQLIEERLGLLKEEEATNAESV